MDNHQDMLDQYELEKEVAAEKAREEGREERFIRATTNTALVMHDMGMHISDIAKATQLTDQQVQDIIQNKD